MALNPPPFNDETISVGNKFSQSWVKWFSSIVQESRAGFTGSFINGDGNTVTVLNGKITDIS